MEGYMELPRYVYSLNNSQKLAFLDLLKRCDKPASTVTAKGGFSLWLAEGVSLVTMQGLAGDWEWKSRQKVILFLKKLVNDGIFWVNKAYKGKFTLIYFLRKSLRKTVCKQPLFKVLSIRGIACNYVGSLSVKTGHQMQHNTNTHIYAENFKNFIKNDEVGQFMFNGLKGQARFLKLKYTSEEIDIAIENCFAYWQEKGATNWLISTPQEQFAKVSRWLTNDFAKTKASKFKEKTPTKAAEYEVLTPEIELSQFNEIYPPGVYSKTFLKHWLSFDIFSTKQEADNYQQQLRDKTVSDERKQFLHNAIRKKYLDYLRRTIAA